jgi:L-rhamnose mutarotase
MKGLSTNSWNMIQQHNPEGGFEIAFKDHGVHNYNIFVDSKPIFFWIITK